MTTSWEVELGHLACHWSEEGWNNEAKRIRYDAAWMRDAADGHGSYLPPLPDFASHSPFGIPASFARYFADQNS